MISPPAILLAYLTTQSSLTALTSTRIWAERNVPMPNFKPDDGAMIAFKQRPGNLDYSSKILRVPFAFKCYAVDELAALALYGVLVDVLQDATYNPMYKAVMELGGQTLRESNAPSDWAYVIAFFACYFRMS